MNESTLLPSHEINKKILASFYDVYKGIIYENKKITLSTNDGVLIARVKEIVRMEGDSNYTKIFFKKGDSLFISKTLKDFENQLMDYQFERIHKSHLINLNYVTKYYKNDGGRVLMEDGAIIAVSTRKKEKLLARLMLL